LFHLIYFFSYTFFNNLKTTFLKQLISFVALSTRPSRVWMSSGINYHELVTPPAARHVIIPPPSRLIVVGDVHGCLAELNILLQKANYNQGNGDEVLLLGDLVNKGPYSAETIQFAKQSGFYTIRGNHDDFALCHGLKLLPPEIRRPDALSYLDKLNE
jgi:hypothetical protein